MTGLIGAITLINIQQNAAAGSQTALASRQAIERAIEGRLESAAAAQAIQIEKIFSDKYATLGQLSINLSGIKTVSDTYSTAPDLSRFAADDAVKSTFTNDSSLLGVWGILERNELGNDNDFINATKYGSNDKGRFASYWNRSTGTVTNAPTDESMMYDETLGESGLPFNYFYTCPVQSGAACLAPPFTANLGGQDILMTTLSLPVKKNGVVTGAVGVDLALTDLQNLALTAKKSVQRGR
ncbi:cache domain-containing protein [Pseudomonas sp. TH10]|uniref:cache domain-containing protein n=1 Tax=Pseudomonas sp. TH10 TaxID=2796376 RepID=UPI001912EE41|nr:cache domain-containing protein [Pseudomonas sp. TH10]MBK5516708.1 PDC sensor domain-containing protein [Pseudomonas sp. TH10]